MRSLITPFAVALALAFAAALHADEAKPMCVCALKKSAASLVGKKVQVEGVVAGRHKDRKGIALICADDPSSSVDLRAATDVFADDAKWSAEGKALFLRATGTVKIEKLSSGRELLQLAYESSEPIEPDAQDAAVVGCAKVRMTGPGSFRVEK